MQNAMLFLIRLLAFLLAFLVSSLAVLTALKFRWQLQKRSHRFSLIPHSCNHSNTLVVASPFLVFRLTTHRYSRASTISILGPTQLPCLLSTH